MQTTTRHKSRPGISPRHRLDAIRELSLPDSIKRLKESMLAEDRYMSIEQARIVTRVYKENQDAPIATKRALALAAALREIEIRIDPNEIVVGNRTAGMRAGVVSPDSGISWLEREIETLETRPQDRFRVRPEDVDYFRSEIVPYWKGKTLEDQIYDEIGDELSTLEYVAKINQKDHAQGHICPNTEMWLAVGPAGLIQEAQRHRGETVDPDKLVFYDAVIVVLEGAQGFMRRYGRLAREKAGVADNAMARDRLLTVARVTEKVADSPPETFHEAIQSLWFLYVVLQMESNASSFSPGRMDQYLYQYFSRDLEEGRLDLAGALELIEALWLKFNQIVYLRNSNSAKYFAGFPIGFNVALGGQTAEGRDASNELSFLFLKAQEHIGLPQPNLSARIFEGSSDELLYECSRVIGKGSGMPQVFNDNAVIPALENRGYPSPDAINYAIVGCVELTTHGNALGWSDAAMFNLVKALELTINDGVCLVTDKQIGLKTGDLTDYSTYEELERAYAAQISHFVGRMMPCCEIVERKHAEILPSAFLSAVIDDCLVKGVDVTAGGARHNFSGIQAIQVANIADSLAVLRKMFDGDLDISRRDMLAALRNNYDGFAVARAKALHKVDKYGNDVAWVDEIGNHWVSYFCEQLERYTNVRGGPYHVGLYTVSAHVPMGKKVGATPDGRRAQEPLADGGMSAVYGRDRRGPTALLKSVSRIDSIHGSNGTLLNMKFLPDLFRSEEGIRTFAGMLRSFVNLKIIHVQFNVISERDLLNAQQHPEQYQNLTVRVAGYTAYFTELAEDLQNEIIARTSHEAAV